MLDELVESVRAAPKYRHLDEELVRGIAQRELDKGLGEKATIKAVKNRLHQCSAAFFPVKPRYAQMLRELKEAEAPLPVLQSLMSRHASTAERLDLLPEFYRKVFDGLGPIHRVLDLGCGFHPLAVPWMGLSEDTVYHAMDVFADLAEFLGACRPWLGVDLRASSLDLLSRVPEPEVDVAFLLKLLPCLEQQQAGSAARLLDGIRAKHLIVSYPCFSLGGKAKGMRENYAAQFEELMRGRDWEWEEIPLSNELVFRLTKPG